MANWALGQRTCPGRRKRLSLEMYSITRCIWSEEKSPGTWNGKGHDCENMGSPSFAIKVSRSEIFCLKCEVWIRENSNTDRYSAPIPKIQTPSNSGLVGSEPQ